ncbi:MAG: hypothetical protein ACI92G_001400 [Candidatus Pelagisphaera sp.]|jgi:hypothetical protein
MSEPSSKEPQDQPENNPLNLSDLQDFSFGTQWTDAGKKPRGGFREGSGRDSRRPRTDRRPSSAGVGGGPSKDRRPQRKAYSDREPRGEGGAQNSRGPREGGQQRGNWRRDGVPEAPYESTIFEVGFYPDDVGFSTIIKALRTNHITYELFQVSKIFLEKSDRYVASVTRKAAKGEKPEPVFVSLPDGMPFATEEEAITHALSNNVDDLFDVEEVEVEAPSGNYQFVNRCGITKELLGPPNYHRYEEFMNRHHQSKLSDVSFERFQSSIVQDREEEAVNEWLESMKKVKRYTSKPVEGEEVQSFDSLNDAIGFLRTSNRDKIVKAVSYARVGGVTLDKFLNTEASRAVSGELARQRRFPLETANAIRGRLRREKFSIYKKGSKGVTLICSTKRRFRTQGQVMSESLDRLIRFLEANQNIKTKELPPAYEAWLKEQDSEIAFDEKKLFQDLHWLIADGYVSHFSDDTLFANPVLENTPKPKAVAKPKVKAVKAAKEAALVVEEAPADAASTPEVEEAVADTSNSSPSESAEVAEAAPATEVAPESETVAEEVVAVAPEAEAAPEVVESKEAPKEAIEESEAAPATEVAPESKTVAEEVAAPEVEAVPEVVESKEAPKEAIEESEAVVAKEAAVETPEDVTSSDETDPEPEKAKTEA